MYDEGATAPPLAVDLFCGLGGWSDGLIAEGYRVVGFDTVRHDHGSGVYPGALVLQDVRTLNGAQFKDAALIVASPPCQAFSYMSLPWKAAKARAAWLRDAEAATERIADLTALFDSCFRIRAEACEAAGRYIPLVVENVKGAQSWVGAARWHFGSYYLWGDVPALMPFAFDVWKGQRKGSWFGDYKARPEGIEAAARLSRKSSESPARRKASAEIAKIPLELARHIARVYKPFEAAA